MVIFKILGGLCFLFGIVDIVSSYVWVDLTGVVWSPWVAFIVGAILFKIGSSGEGGGE